MPLEPREQLVELIADEFIANGNVRASLRDIASVVGTSARMLVHHFGNRKHLMHEVLEVARARQLAAAQKAIGRSLDVEPMMLDVWRWYQRSDTRRFFVLFNDVAALEQAEAPADRQFGLRLGAEWRPMFEQAFRADPVLAPDAAELAQLVIATIRGLALDLRNGASTKDQKATYDVLTAMILERRTSK